jgi:hypothetical protein
MTVGFVDIGGIVDHQSRKKGYGCTWTLKNIKHDTWTQIKVKNHWSAFYNHSRVINNEHTLRSVFVYVLPLEIQLSRRMRVGIPFTC